MCPWNADLEAKSLTSGLHCLQCEPAIIVAKRAQQSTSKHSISLVPLAFHTYLLNSFLLFFEEWHAHIYTSTRVYGSYFIVTINIYSADQVTAH